MWEKGEDFSANSYKNLPRYAMHGDHRHGQLKPEAKYLEAATHGSR